MPASRLPHAELAAVFTAGYEGYYMPVAVDEASFGFMARAWDYDLDASLVARADDGPVGLVMLGRRGDEGWIGGVGVVPKRRAEGVGRRLMDAVAAEAKAHGVERLWLEVLVQNEPAIGLYEKLGYEHVRELETWALDQLEDERRHATTIAVDDAIGRVTDRLPWQRADETIKHLDDAQALATESGALIYQTTAGTASLLQVAAGGEGAVRELLAAIPRDTTAVRYVNGPTGDPVNAVLKSLGGVESARQYEMVLTL